MNSTNQVLRWLVVLAAVFIAMPVIYELLKIFMPLVFGFIGIFAFSKILLGKFKKW